MLGTLWGHRLPALALSEQGYYPADFHPRLPRWKMLFPTHPCYPRPNTIVKLWFNEFIPCIEEVIHCNTNMIHFPEHSPDQKIVDDQIVLKSYLSCVHKSTTLSNCAEDVNCSREFIHQSAVCPFIPEQSNKNT